MGIQDEVLKQIFQNSSIPDAKNMDWLTGVDPEKAKAALADLHLPDEEGSSYDVNESSSPVTMNGRIPDAPIAPALSPTPAEMPPVPPTETAAPVAPPVPAMPNPSKPMAPMAAKPKEQAAPVDDNDNKERAALREKESRDKVMGILPGAAGAIADAAGNAAAAYGGKGNTNNVDEVLNIEKQNKELGRTDLEKKLKDDPNSDISKHYQKVLGLMLGKPESDSMIAGRSANQIAETLPEVEKFMQKELQVEAIKSNKELAMSMQNGNQQDKLEQQYRTSLQRMLSNRSGGLGLQDQKVNSAIHARQLLEGARNPKTGEIDLNQVATPELAMTLANLVSGTNTTSLEQFKSMSPQSLQQNVKEKVGYLFGKPVSVLPKAWVEALGKMVDRQGLTSEQLRDHYMDTIKSQRPTRLDAQRATQLEREELGNSYADTFGLPRLNKPGDKATPTPTATEQVKTVNGKHYVSHGGEWYEVQ